MWPTMSRKRARHDFDEQAKVMLESFQKLRFGFDAEMVSDFQVKLRMLMICKMPSETRKDLEEICHQFNFLAFDQKGFISCIDSFKKSFERVGKCKRSNPPINMTQIARDGI